MLTFRKIIVESKEFLWKYSFDDADYQCDSFIVVKTVDKKGKLVVYFRTEKADDYGRCPFNKGVLALFKNEVTIINLNQPRFVAEIISYVLEQRHLDCLVGTVELKNGIEILHDIGYEFEYQKSWS